MENYQKILIFCLIYYINGIYCVEKHEDEKINFVKDYLIYSNTPVHLTGFLCWNNENSIKLIKTLSKHGFLSNVMLDCNLGKLLSPNQHIFFLLDISCSIADDCLKLADKLKLFSSPYRWIILDRSKSTPEFNYHLILRENARIPDTQRTILEHPYEYFGNKSILSDNNILVATRDAQHNYILTQYYKHRKNSTIINEHFGYWNQKRGIIDERSNEIIATRRKNLQNTVLTASIVITDNNTMNHLSDYRDVHIDTITKVNYALTKYLIDFLNGTHNFTFVDNWGYKMPDGGWSGMIGDMTRLEADIGGTALFVTSDRISTIEYISMTTPTKARFVFRQPPLSYVSNIFVLPFRWTVWSAVIILVVLVCLALYGAAVREQKQLGNNGVSGEAVNYDRIPGRWGDIFMLAIGAVAQQGSHSELKSISGRIIIIMLFIALMFLYTSYSANIVALLQSQSSSINSLSDLLNSRLKLGAQDVVYNRYYFPRATEPVRKAIWMIKIAPKGSNPHFYPLEEGVELIRKGLFAFHMEVSNGYKIMSDTFQESEKCGLGEITFLDVNNPWYAVQKNSSFKEMFKIGMRRIQEFGLQAREVNKLYTKKPTCTTTGGGGFVSVGLIEVRPALIWLAFGMALAIAIFVFEQVHKSRRLYIDRLANRLRSNAVSNK